MSEQFTGARHLVVGYGVSGHYHEAGAARLGLPVKVYDLESERVENAGKGTQSVGSLPEGIDWATQVSICTPDDNHTEIAIQAVEAGLHVLCEKPLTAPGVDRNALNDALAIQQAVHKMREAAHNPHIIVGTGYRLTPAFQEIARMIQTGQLGKLERAYLSYMHDMGEFYNPDGVRYTPWRPARQQYQYGGGIHAVDLAYHVLGEVIQVEATALPEKRYPQFRFPEAYSVRMVHTDGTVSEMDFSAHKASQFVTQDVWGDSGIDIANPPHGSDLIAYGQGGEIRSAHAHNKFPRVATVRNSGDIEYIERPPIYTVDAEIRILTELAQGNGTDTGGLPDIDEGVRVMCIMEALDRSVSAGGEPVQVEYR